MPGYYGVGNVKWLQDIQVQSDRYLGLYQARHYRTVKGEMINGEMKWVETAVTRMQLKSFVARITKEGDVHKVTGVALNDGTEILNLITATCTLGANLDLYALRLDRDINNSADNAFNKIIIRRAVSCRRRTHPRSMQTSTSALPVSEMARRSSGRTTTPSRSTARSTPVM